jgi:hypothetical protein
MPVAHAKRGFGTAMWKVPADILAAPKRRRLSDRRKLIIVDDFLPQHVSLVTPATFS